MNRIKLTIDLKKRVCRPMVKENSTSYLRQIFKIRLLTPTFLDHLVVAEMDKRKLPFDFANIWFAVSLPALILTTRFNLLSSTNL